MIVDDTAFVRELVKAVMKSEGHLCVAEASDGVEAQELLAQTLPDLVLVDLVMPRMNGVTATKQMRATWPEGRFIALTTMEREQLKAEELALFDAWIEKPFEKERFLESIRLTVESGRSAEGKNG